MQNRLRLLMGASALLYFGPLLAGLIGLGWNAAPVFIALFALWLVVMRPAQWPRDLSDWTGETVLAAMAQLAVNTLLVLILFATGRGLGGVAGFVPNLPAVLPVGLAFLATPLSRLIWNPQHGDATHQLMQDALRQIHDPAFHPLTGGPRDVMVDTLLGLPEGADPDLTAQALDAALRGHQGGLRLSLLEAALEHAHPPRLALRQGLILWATDPARTPGGDLHGGPATAFSLAGLRPDLLALFATRGLAALHQTPALAADFPQSRDIEITIDDSQPPQVQQALAALAHHMKQAEQASLGA
ncbi:hypothetical protein [Pseudotabrizicola sp. L79]|uniref:hypothetical protein n=1 Tax=Pseudotabrizicola sp. L79 TaxID=3118402 RepID=UPI002F942AE8